MILFFTGLGKPLIHSERGVIQMVVESMQEGYKSGN